MPSKFFKIRENIQDFINREISQSTEFCFLLSDSLILSESDSGKTMHWLVQSKNKRVLEEFKAELERKYGSNSGFYNNCKNNGDDFIYLLLVVRI